VAFEAVGGEGKVVLELKGRLEVLDQYRHSKTRIGLMKPVKASSDTR
jgi:hypothetical protein